MKFCDTFFYSTTICAGNFLKASSIKEPFRCLYMSFSIEIEDSLKDCKYT